MSGPWPMTVKQTKVGHGAAVQLGKMLQPTPVSSADAEVTYVRAGHLGTIHLSPALPTMWASPTDKSRYGIACGDLLVGEGGDVGRTAFAPHLPSDCIIQNSVHRLRPRFGHDIRFIRYCLDSIHSGEWLDVLCNRSTFGHLTKEKLVGLPIPALHLNEQRAIADCLDLETTRIDALIAKRKRMVALLTERRAGIIESMIRDLSKTWGERGLRFVAPEILVGIVVTPAAFYAYEGVLALRGTNVKPGRLDLTDTVTLSDDGHALHPTSILRGGDVVVVRTGQAGAACVVPPELDGANCIDVLIVRRSQTLDPSFLEYVLNSDWTTKHIAEHSVGTIQSHFNVGALKELPIPVPPIEVQTQVAKDLAQAVARVDRLKQMTERQVDLLVEHRQALIAAAVTGELEIPGVAA